MTHIDDVSPSQALRFVENITLVPLSAEVEAQALEGMALFDFEKDKAQALVVGSDVISFVKGVTEEQRRDITNSALLAQLVANQQVPDATDIFAWYDAYFSTLINVGWLLQTNQFSRHVEQSDTFEAHKAILEIATSLLGPGAAALQLVKATLDALSNLDQDSPWITLFHRESQHANAARFQITLADQNPEGQFLITLLAFGLTASSELTQVLFFKFKSNEVELRHASGTVTISEDVISAIRNSISEKLQNYAQKFIRQLPDF
jgi:hypothetical protein